MIGIAGTGLSSIEIEYALGNYLTDVSFLLSSPPLIFDTDEYTDVHSVRALCIRRILYLKGNPLRSVPSVRRPNV